MQDWSWNNESQHWDEPSSSATSSFSRVMRLDLESCGAGRAMAMDAMKNARTIVRRSLRIEAILVEEERWSVKDV